MNLAIIEEKHERNLYQKFKYRTIGRAGFERELVPYIRPFSNLQTRPSQSNMSSKGSSMETTGATRPHGKAAGRRVMRKVQIKMHVHKSVAEDAAAEANEAAAESVEETVLVSHPSKRRRRRHASIWRYIWPDEIATLLSEQQKQQDDSSCGLCPDGIARENRSSTTESTSTSGSSETGTRVASVPDMSAP
ncbi:hypothetical protein EJ06DRAFT_368068 [Trichodelitschia bisporula]|uniref:Uncharacterized protein n=1 Tax=Trichodelitschia bisporula TaxID=703511 RepID=A0A6G1I1I1_9PEZI|nr:hypothetical protein EJ06DRAFT_368068 [Trichodelitschia bisporula]